MVDSVDCAETNGTHYTSEELECDQRFVEVPILVAVLTYVSYATLYLLGHLRDFVARLLILCRHVHPDPRTAGFVPLLSDFESFYTRHLYKRLDDCWNRPIQSCAGAEIDVLGWRKKSPLSPARPDGTCKRSINMVSYNYLGFGEPSEECSHLVEDSLRRYGITTCSTSNEYGYFEIHRDTERAVAEFLGTEDAICFAMGFATNSGNLQALLDERCCIISDELNHASLVLGSRLTGSKIYTFKHNDMNDLETVVRDCIVQGRPKFHRPWDKIVVIVEGIYSMEGTFIDLPAIIRLKRKYNFYIYLDEAHSIGCIGPSGRGVAELFNVDRSEVDVFMGTFTKSFGSCGGYIASTKAVVAHIKRNSYCANYGVSMPPAVCAQVIASLDVIKSDAGKLKLERLRSNIKYLRENLRRMGFVVYGHDLSPVVPVLIFMPAKLGLFVRMMLENRVSVVVVGFPATSVMTSRSRFCISSSHTKEMLDEVVRALDKVGDKLHLKYSGGGYGILDRLLERVARP